MGIATATEHAGRRGAMRTQLVWRTSSVTKLGLAPALRSVRPAQFAGYDAYELISLIVGVTAGTALIVRLLRRPAGQRRLRRSGLDELLLVLLIFALVAFGLRQVADEACHGSCSLGPSRRPTPAAVPSAGAR